jgi:hypothetical protein
MKHSRLIALALAGALSALAATDPLEHGFAHPPPATKPWCYWYWISDHLSKEGITRDLEAMARVGIGEVFIGNIFLEGVPPGNIKVLSPEWWGLVEHAIREGARTGVNIGMFNCPGWSQSGGPWITPEQTMRYLATSEIHVTGPRRLTQPLPVPAQPFQDVAVLAFPAPRHDVDSLARQTPRFTSAPPAHGLDRLMDGDPATVTAFPAGAGRGTSPFTIDWELSSPWTARSLRIVPGTEPFAADVELQAATRDGPFQTVRRFRCDRSNLAIAVGFLPRGPVTVSFPATTAPRFRLVFTGVSGSSRQIELAEIELSGAARLESYVEKQIGKMHPTPLPMWDTYLWPTQPEPDSRELVVPAREVRDLTSQLAADGTLEWDVPAGEWVVQRIGMTPTGMRNSPASPEGQGLEVDKLNRTLAAQHFEAFIGEVLRRVPAADRSAFTRVVADSYEMGAQNWTDGFDTAFRQRYGYDPIPWLPVLSGRLIGSADQSERFLWDLRRLVADRVASEYVGGLRDACRAHGLGLWLENYGHWGFPAEFLQYGGASDRVGGEYWVTGDLGSIECRAAASCANTYGMPIVSAEAFTGGPAFQNAPRDLKARGDWAFCEGINHFVLHVYIHQPWADKVPGVNAWFGTEFNRHNTWFESSRAWIDYLRRCCWLLQQGHRVADVAYFIGEDAPKMTGLRQPPLPAGRDFDYLNAEVLLAKLTVQDGLLALPHGTTYRLLVLPELDTMRPAVLRKLRDLVHAGATVLGPPPSRSPSLQDYPDADLAVRKLADELWGSADPRRPGERAFGRGRVLWGKPLEAVLTSLNSPPAFESSASLRFTHRRQGEVEIFFVANPKAEPLTTTAAFRAGDKAPEFWWPDSGRLERPAVYDVAEGTVRLPLSFGPHGSVFVVFRSPAAPASDRVVAVRREGAEVLGTRVTPTITGADAVPPDNFTFAAWIKPTAATALTAETNRGTAGLGLNRNDALAAPHGDGFGGSGQAGCGLAVGTNGVCVLEHGANYFAPTLVHPAPLADWTHVTVVYRDGQPSLYLDGGLARTGLRSEHTVHSGAAAGGVAQFRGRLGTFSQFGRALAPAEVAALTRSMPRPDRLAAGPAIELTSIDGYLHALARESGDFELMMADGQRRALRVPPVPPPTPLPGPWEVQFAPGWGAPERGVFPELLDWTRHPDAGIRHFSGQATYRRTFSLPPPLAADPNARILLDLGEVRDLATVRVNGRELATLWLTPFQVDLTGVVQPGENTLEVAIVNVWNNRLAGDAALPAEQRRTSLLAPTVGPDAPLLPAGLLGPVTLRYAAAHRAR